MNGMFTRDADEPGVDVDSFFWRQVVAQSPLIRKPGTPYDDGWRATNRLLVGDGAQAQHERNVLLRNNGRGGFDEVSGSAGLDMDQDGRSFAVFDYDARWRSGRVLMAPRSSPQLRLFRNDYAAGHAALALRLKGTKSNRDAVGARVTIETDQIRITRIVTLAPASSRSIQGAADRPGQEPAHRQGDDRVAERPGADTCRTFRSVIACGWKKDGDLRTEPFRTNAADDAGRAAHSLTRNRLRDVAVSAGAGAGFHAAGSRRPGAVAVGHRRSSRAVLSGRPGRHPLAPRSRSCRARASP